MHARSASFNSAVLVAACGLLIVDGGINGDAADEPMPPLRDDPRCSSTLRVVLSTENGVAARLLKNGSLLHDGVAYPADVRWTEGNLTYGCICRIRDCVNKCCRNDEVLRRDHKKRMVCQKVSQGDEPITSDLRLSANRMTEEIRHIGKLADHFRLAEQLVSCPNRTITFSPDDHEQDHIVLQANGSVVDIDGKIYPFWNYCIDWHSTLDKIGIVACLMPDMQTASEEEYTAHHVGIIVSIPFLVATFLVYAIIPELRNLYGKTLMCYVICLITAYVFLILVNYIHMSLIRVLCLFSAVVFANGQMEEESKRSGQESFITSHVYLETTTDSIDDDSEKPYISLCCHIGTFVTGDKCVGNATNETETTVELPAIYEDNLVPTNITANDKHFHFEIWNPCAGGNRYSLSPHVYEDEKWYLLPNGSILRPRAEQPQDRILNYSQYCLARARSEEYRDYLVFFCEEAYPEDDSGGVVYSYGMLASVSFLTATYVVYWLLPELRNLHGLTLRGYVGCLAMAYGMLAVVQLTPQEQIPYVICIALGILAE